MTCCIEDAVIDALAELAGTPIKRENLFVNERTGDCMPYGVVRASNAPGLRTSDMIQVISTVSIQAFFSKNEPKQAQDFKSAIEELLFSSANVPLGSCGTICVRSISPSRVLPQADGLLRYEVTIVGAYAQSGS